MFFDRIARRYADPFGLLSAYLEAGQLHRCVVSMIEALNKETREQVDAQLESRIWDMWVHKYEGKKAYGEYRQTIMDGVDRQNRPKPKAADPESMAHSMGIATATLNKLRGQDTTPGRR